MWQPLNDVPSSHHSLLEENVTGDLCSRWESDLFVQLSILIWHFICDVIKGVKVPTAGK